MSKHHRRIPAKRWARIRCAILRRDRYRCRACGKPGRLEIDHVIPLQRGGHPTDPGNLQTLCTDCHFQKNMREKDLHPDRRAWLEFVGRIG